MRTTIPTLRGRVTEKRHWISPHTAGLRLARYAEQAERLFNAEYDGKARTYGPLVTAKKMTAAKNGGGDLTDVYRFMLAHPLAAQRIAAQVQAVADDIINTAAPSLLGAIVRAAVADADEDQIRTSVLAALVEHRLNIAELDALVDVCDRVEAKTRTVRLCASRERQALS